MGKDRNKDTSKSGPLCNYCKTKGQLSNDNRPSPNAPTAVLGKFTYSPFEYTNVKPETDVLREELRSFVFYVLVSVDNPIRILRNTGASQSLFL